MTHIRTIAFLVAMAIFTFPLRGAEPDLATPKAAVKSMMSAILAGDANTAKACAVGNDDQVRIVSVMSNLVRSVLAFEKGARAKFGDAAKPMTDPMTQGLKELEGDMKKVEEADVKIDGDNATITKKDDADKPIKLKKSDGKWKVDLASIKDFPGKEEVAGVEKMGKALDTITAGINEGKYKTVEEVGQALAAAISQ